MTASSDRSPGTRDHLLLALNGELVEVRGDDAFLPLSTWLRERRRLVGTKIVCSEGDCGACTVLLGTPTRVAAKRPASGALRMRYRPIDSCIAFLHQLDGRHVVTVEGLADGEALHPVQRAMAEKFGSQCGYCTPGFVVALAGLAGDARERGATLTDPELRVGLSGNLCRCTGYVQILDAARAVDPGSTPAPWERFDEDTLSGALAAACRQTVRVESGERSIAIPARWREALEQRSADPEAIVVAGATDLGVQVNKRLRAPRRILRLRPELDGHGDIEIRDGVLRLGAGAVWSDVLGAVRAPLPELARLLELFGAPQIRHAGTIGGNLANASPIADSLPWLYASEATVELDSVRGRRTLPIADLYLGYKQLALEPDELLAGVVVPLPGERETLRLAKISRRRDLDISTFGAALWLRRSADGATIERARLALGGVAATVVRSPEAEGILNGAPFELETFRAAGERAAAAIRPLTDVRGSEEYRRLLARNALVRFFHELREPAAELTPAGRPA